MVARGLGRTGLFLIRTLGALGGVGGVGALSELDPQGTARLMCGARGLDDTLDFEGSLQALAGAPNVAAVGALLLLGASGGEIVGNVNELAGTVGLELGEAMRAWAFSGAY